MVHGRRGAAQARAWSIRHLLKPRRPGKATREQNGHRKPQWEDTGAQLFEEELVLAEKEGVMEFEEEIAYDLCVGDPVTVEKLVAEAERKVKLALEEAEMAAAEAESCEMELEMLLKELGLRG
ncbi:unnamed protein product [Symbiodinium sp. CCMP2456]|nr:unnamed protein product [Symbiodinium sp. CCMP2456]